SGLFISDQNNNRVLGYGTTTATFLKNSAAATLVIGQADFTHGAANHGNATPDGIGLNVPGHVATDGKRLYVADTQNNRVLVWNSILAASNGASADFAIGQPSLTTNAPGAGQTGLDAPRGVAATKNRLVIADTGNNRVLVWQPPP